MSRPLFLLTLKRKVNEQPTYLHICALKGFWLNCPVTTEDCNPSAANWMFQFNLLNEIWRSSPEAHLHHRAVMKTCSARATTGVVSLLCPRSLRSRTENPKTQEVSQANGTKLCSDEIRSRSIIHAAGLTVHHLTAGCVSHRDVCWKESSAWIHSLIIDLNNNLKKKKIHMNQKTKGCDGVYWNKDRSDGRAEGINLLCLIGAALPHK